jgi:hypothetical protein
VLSFLVLLKRPSLRFSGLARTGVLCLAYAAAAGCRTPSTPEGVGLAYARALREGRTRDAYGLTSPEFRGRVSEQGFQARYADPAKRAERAAQMEGALEKFKVTAPGVAMVRRQEGWRVEEGDADEGGPAQTLERFLDAAERGDFVAAYGLLAASWRARYTPERLKEDFGREPLARERLVRARRALERPPSQTDQGVEYPLGDGKAVRLVREADGFRVAALE